MRQTLCIIVLSAVAASTLRVPTTTTPDPRLGTCTSKYEITEDVLSRVHSNPEPMLKDPETRCFAACVLTDNNTLNPDGTLNIASVIEYLPKNIADREKVIEAFNACANEKGVDSCETAYKTVVCINSKDVIRNMRPSS